MITVKVGNIIRCNTVGHPTSGLTGVLTRICDTEEDKKLGLSADYGIVDGKSVNLHQCVTLGDDRFLRTAFARLMGENGDSYVEEIRTTGKLSPESYRKITENTFFNGQDSIVNYFGLVQWYYMMSRKSPS